MVVVPTVVVFVAAIVVATVEVVTVVVGVPKHRLRMHGTPYGIAVL